MVIRLRCAPLHAVAYFRFLLKRIFAVAYFRCRVFLHSVSLLLRVFFRIIVYCSSGCNLPVGICLRADTPKKSSAKLRHPQELRKTLHDMYTKSVSFHTFRTFRHFSASENTTPMPLVFPLADSYTGRIVINKYFPWPLVSPLVGSIPILPLTAYRTQKRLPNYSTALF